MGEEVTLSCSVDQFTDEVHWEKDGVRLDTSERVTVLHGTGLLIHSAMEEDSGVYACVASNEEGARRAAAFVNITGPLLSCNGEFLQLYSFSLGEKFCARKKCFMQFLNQLVTLILSFYL